MNLNFNQYIDRSCTYFQDVYERAAKRIVDGDTIEVFQNGKNLWGTTNHLIQTVNILQSSTFAQQPLS